MSNLASTIRTFRESSRLSQREMALFLDIEERELCALEEGDAFLEPSLLAEYARIAGVEIAEFGAQAAPCTPTSMLFRTMPNRESSTEEFAYTGTHRILGEFLRCTRRVSRLHERLDTTPDRSRLQSWWRENPPLSLSAYDSNIYDAARDCAARVREHLGLGQEPIESMHRLMEDLGVAIFYVRPDELTPVIDGVSTIEPGPAVLVNLIDGEHAAWRTRMTLAHELGHLLMDLSCSADDDREHRSLMLSPSYGERKLGTCSPQPVVTAAER